MPANDEEENEKESQHRYEETALSKKLKKTKCGTERDRGRFAPY